MHRRFAQPGGLGVILNKMVMKLKGAAEETKTYTSKNMVTSVEVTL